VKPVHGATMHTSQQSSGATSAAAVVICVIECLRVRAHAMAHCQEKLLPTVCTIVVSCKTQLDAFVLQHIGLLLWSSNVKIVMYASSVVHLITGNLLEMTKERIQIGVANFYTTVQGSVVTLQHIVRMALVVTYTRTFRCD